ncbi:MAG: hypothetical protein GX488_06125 [Clostridiales bacterium]|nr:hypothetical protein [Clostridiales bacterium]
MTFRKELKSNSSRKEYHRTYRFATEMYSEPDPILGIFQHIVVAVCTAYEGGVSGILGAEKNAHNLLRNGYRCGRRPGRLDTRIW